MATINVEGYGKLNLPDEAKSWPKERIDAMVAEAIAAKKPVALSDIPGEALRNLPESAANFVSDIVQPFLSPVETAKNLGNVALGTVQKLIPGEQDSEKYANAVGQFFADRYGGWENFKRTMAKDPVGFLGDLATVLTGGGAAVARAPGVAGSVGKAAQTVGNVVDPIMIAGRAAKPVAAGLGVTTGTSQEAVARAAQAGYAGGQAGEAFKANMRGAAPVEDVVSTARDALGQMRETRSTAYTTEMTKLGKRPEILDFTKADDALSKAMSDFGYKGVFPDKLQPVRHEVEHALDKYRVLDPAQYHTPAGFDALKKELWAIQGEHQVGTAQHSFVQAVRKAVEKEIKTQAPEYSKIMRDYRTASETIDEIERSLSLGNKATVDTALRKLQSIMRNNANTNYGARVNMGELLAQSGATNLMEMLAGQALNAWAPRGIARAGMPALAGGAYAVNPALAAMLPLQSPRLMGEAAYGAGAAARYANQLFDLSQLPRIEATPSGAALTAFQAGRLENR